MQVNDKNHTPIVTNWHFSCSFHLIFLNTYGPYLLRSYLIKQPTLIQTILTAHFVHRTIKSVCIQSPNVANTTLKLQTDDPFQPKQTTALYERPKAWAGRQDQPLHQGWETLDDRSSGSLPRHLLLVCPLELKVPNDTMTDH